MTEDERKIRDVVNTWMEASANGDLDTVLSLMADDIVFSVPGREPFGKTEFAEMSRAMGDVGMDAKTEIVELQVLGDWAFIRNHISVSITVDGQTSERSGYTLSLLRREKDGRWRFARDANLVT